jgi:chlorobactene glucosyltransferase
MFWYFASMILRRLISRRCDFSIEGIFRFPLASLTVPAYTGRMHSPRFSVNWLRTLVINIITASVAMGLARNRRRNRELPEIEWPEGQPAPFVQVIVPARNEEDNIGALIESLLQQRYPAGRWRITLVDDGSVDATLQVANKTARDRPEYNALSAPTPPQGWTGKSNAMYAGYLASPTEATWLLFVDADTRHSPLMLASVIQHAMQTHADLLSLVIDVKMESFWERVLVPQVGELYTLLVGTMDHVNDGGRRGAAAANGQFMLIKRWVFAELGALPSVRGDVAEDRALAQALKQHGFTVSLEYGRNLVSTRVYSSLRDMWNGYSKTLFWASGRDTGRALATVAALSFYALMPPLLLALAIFRRDNGRRNSALAHAAMQMLPMLALRVRVCQHMGIPARYALTYPLGVAIGNGMLLASTFRVLSGKGVRWKGRTYR